MRPRPRDCVAKWGEHDARIYTRNDIRRCADGFDETMATVTSVPARKEGVKSAEIQSCDTQDDFTVMM